MSDQVAPERSAAAPPDDAPPGGAGGPGDEPPTRPETRITAFLGAAQRDGAWQPGRRVVVLAVCGGATVDFNYASLEPGVTAVQVNAVVGSVVIRAPDAVRVESRGSGVFGAFTRCSCGPTRDGVPVLEIDGTAVFGSVVVQLGVLEPQLAAESPWPAPPER